MTQDFALRYPLIDGQGNFGSRDGAAAMRYTAARLSPIARLLMDEIDEGTVDFIPNYDGSTEEPRQLPARLPFALLNGASGIAVGLATEIPSHNLREVSAAAIALIKDEQLCDDALYALVPGPDYPGGGQIISSAADIRDGSPTQESLRQMFTEWIDFRQVTVARRSQHRLDRVLARIHVLEGRQLVLLNIDEVIRIIRESDEPKPALIARFGLSGRQTEDILDIRLRQLARLEAIKIEQELKTLREDQGRLEEILGSPATLKRLLIKEIEADTKAHGDDRRTLIQAEKRAVAEIRVVNEPVTVVVSGKGWVRAG